MGPSCGLMAICHEAESGLVAKAECAIVPSKNTLHVAKSLEA